MKIRSLLISTALSLFACQAWAAEIVVLVHASNGTEKLSENELKDFYNGNKDKLPSKVKVRLGVNSAAKAEFFDKLGISESTIAASRATLLAKGQAGSSVPLKTISQDDIVSYLTVMNKDGGLSFMKKEDFDKLGDDVKKQMKVVATL